MSHLPNATQVARVVGVEVSRTDSVPGVRVDTVHGGTENGLHRSLMRVSFDSLGALTALAKTRGGPSPPPTSLTRADSELRIVIHPGAMTRTSGAFGSQALRDIRRAVTEGRIRGRMRYVFPKGTTIRTARPPVVRTDDAVIYQVELSEVMDPAAPDSLHVAVELAGPR